MEHYGGYLVDLVKDQQYEGFLLVRSAEVKVSQSQKKYVDLVLGDRTGEIAAKWWDGQEVPALRGEIVKVRATANEFMGKLQLRVERIRPVQPEDDVRLDELVPVAPYDPESMWLQVQEAAEGIADAQVRSVVLRLLDVYGGRLLTAPAAAQFHHSVRGGLLWHMTGMLRAAHGMLAAYPHLNDSLLVAGVLIHDLCKIEEMNISPLGLADDYARAGMLLGHIPLGVARVLEAAAEVGCGEETAQMLAHMVLSHHGVPEYGSPRAPMFPEAEVLHHLDVLDARLYDMEHALEGTQPGAFSERVRSLENRKLYRREVKKDDDGK